jgi:hypothetical protein
MHPTTARLRLILLSLAFVCALALTGVIVQKPHGGLAGAVSDTIMHGWPVTYLAIGHLHHYDKGSPYL